MNGSQNQRCVQRTKSGRPCNAWAVRGSDPPTCSVHDGRCRGFYGSAIHPEELADLVAYAGDLTLEDEIACARVALRRVLAALSAPGDTGAEGPLTGDALSAGEFARVAGLAFQGARTVSRLLRDQRALSGDAAEGISGAIAAALDELSTMWGVDL